MIKVLVRGKFKQTEGEVNDTYTQQSPLRLWTLYELEEKQGNSVLMLGYLRQRRDNWYWEFCKGPGLDKLEHFVYDYQMFCSTKQALEWLADKNELTYSKRITPY